MSRTIRRGKPSRNFHKYIGLGIIEHENRRWYHWRGMGEHQGHLFWKDGANDPTTYEEYTSLKIRRYHMDYRCWTKTPSWCYRVEVQKQKRAHKAALHHALATGREDELILVRSGQDAEWMWW